MVARFEPAQGNGSVPIVRRIGRASLWQEGAVRKRLLTRRAGTGLSWRARAAAVGGALAVSAALFAALAWTQVSLGAREAIASPPLALAAVQLPERGAALRWSELAPRSSEPAPPASVNTAQPDAKRPPEPERAGDSIAMEPAALASGDLFTFAIPAREAWAEAALLSSDEASPGAEGQPGRAVAAAAQGLKFVRRTAVLEISMLHDADEIPLPRRVVKPPLPVFQEKLKYPADAEKKEIEGRVRVRVMISESGAVARIELLAAEPPGYFEEAVQEAVSKWKFNPAQDAAGKPIECWKEFTCQFRLESK